MTSDPRLSDVSLLTLAAMRAYHRRRAPGGPAQDWLHTEGLHALLETARQQEASAGSVSPVVGRQGAGAMARLLQEARQFREEGRYGA